MDHIDNIIDNLDISNEEKERFKICNIFSYHKYCEGKIKYKLFSSPILRKLKLMQRHSLLFPTYRPDLIFWGPLPFFQNNMTSLGTIFLFLIFYIYFNRPDYTIFIIPILWLFIGTTNALSFTRYNFNKNVLKNPEIKKLILSKEINVIPKPEFIVEMLNKYNKKKFISLALLEFLFFFSLFLVFFCPHILTQVGGRIGCMIQKLPNAPYAYISNLKTNSPAEQSGIKAGDEIIAINGESTLNKSKSEVASELKGNSKTDVKILVLRANKKLDFKIKRENVKIDWNPFI